MRKFHKARLVTAAIFAGATGAASAHAQAPAGQAAADALAAVPAPRPADVASSRAIVLALYDVISGDAGVKRDWNRFRSLFYPGAQMIPTSRNAETGAIAARIMTPEDYVNLSGPRLEEGGFHEVEIAWREQHFGQIAQVFTTYAARRKLSDKQPFMRGINSVHLFNDGKRWWITNITWSAESPDHRLPPKYLRSAK